MTQKAEAFISLLRSDRVLNIGCDAFLEAVTALLKKGTHGKAADRQAMKAALSAMADYLEKQSVGSE